MKVLLRKKTVKVALTILLLVVIFSHYTHAQIGFAQRRSEVQLGVGITEVGIIGNVYYVHALDKSYAGLLGTAVNYAQVGNIDYYAVYFDAMISRTVTNLKIGRRSFRARSGRGSARRSFGGRRRPGRRGLQRNRINRRGFGRGYGGASAGRSRRKVGGFQLNFQAGPTLVYDAISDFKTEVTDQRSSINYGLIAGMEGEYVLSGTTSLVLGGNGRYYIEEDFGNIRYQMFIGFRYALSNF